MQYKDMLIEASEATVERGAGKSRWRRFKVRVLGSPAGEMAPEQAILVQCDERELQKQLHLLETRQLDRDGFFALGRLLGALLLPPALDKGGSGVRKLFAQSLDRVGQDAGLRLRLRLPSELAAVPWEYLYLDRLDDSDTMAGFLALDPRVALVRHETLPVPAPVPRTSGTISVLAVLASPPGFEPLDLDREEQHLQQAVAQQPGMQLTLLKDATLDEVQEAIPGMRVFHFAGHGAFRQQAGEAPGTVTGTGALALDDGIVDAEQLSLNLRGNGVRLVVLGGCETGRRAGAYVWGGIAPALVRFGVPAVVAHQYAILDQCAIAFSRQFYRALAGGLSIERAVSAGRIAAYNVDQSGRDWGVPVLYLRAADGELFQGPTSGELFEGAADERTRAAARQGAEADVNVQVKEVAAGGFVLGAEVCEMLSGKLRVELIVSGTVDGKVVGAKLGVISGGSMNVTTQAETIKGSVTGAEIDQLGS